MSAPLIFLLSGLTLHGRYVWPTGWGPTYRYSYAICIATSGFCVLLSYGFKLHLEYLNRQFEKREKEEGRPQGFRYLT